MAVQNIQYGLQSGVPWTLISLASDSNLLAGRESSLIDNTISGASLYPDYLMSARIATGQSPTVSTNIELWVAGTMAITGASQYVFPDTLAGTDAAKTLTSANVKYTALGLASVITIDALSNRQYDVKPFSVAGLFGGICPMKFSAFITHNTAVALSPTGTRHALWVTPVTYTIA